MDAAERQRYSRQILFSGIGEEGQEALLRSHAAVVGCGALGSFHVSALARAGVGTLTIVIMVSLASGVRQQINRQFESLGLDRLTVTSSGGRRGPPFNPFDASPRKKIITVQDVKRWKELPGVVKVIPEINLPGSVGLDLRWNGTNQSVRMSGGEPMGGNPFQETPQPPLAAVPFVPFKAPALGSHLGSFARRKRELAGQELS